jgi:hypothetical protein
MWFGLLIREEADGDADLVTLCAWGQVPERRIRVTGVPGGMYQCASLLRATQGFGACFAMPRCPHCDAQLDVPDIDASREEREAA